MKEREVEEKVCNRIKNQLIHNKLSHAYLIESNDYINIESLMLRVVKTILCSVNGEHSEKERCEQCRLIDTNQCADLKVIFPQGNNIKKEQLLEVKDLFKTTSFNKYRIYIIYEAEKLNPASANTILKFLEEPEEGIIAFLVARNRYQVLETLVSRCQLLTIHNSFVLNSDSLALEFLQRVTTNFDFYMDFKDIFSIYFPDKETALSLLNELEFYLHQLLLDRIHKKDEVLSMDSFVHISNENIVKYILIIEEEKQKLVYNINYRLWLDHFLVRLLEVLV